MYFLLNEYATVKIINGNSFITRLVFVMHSLPVSGRSAEQIPEYILMSLANKLSCVPVSFYGSNNCFVACITRRSVHNTLVFPTLINGECVKLGLFLFQPSETGERQNIFFEFDNQGVWASTE